MHRSDKFARELFDALSRRRSISGDSITKEQLKEFLDQIIDPSSDGPVQTFFDMADKDADGRITADEVIEIISLSASANKLSNIQKQADEYARLIMEELDPDNLRYIAIENLEKLLLQAPNSLDHGSGEGLKKWYRDFHYFLVDNNWQRIWVMSVWIGVMGGLFAYKYVQLKNRAVFQVVGHCVCVAKGAAETLKLNMALVLLSMCRNTVTWLRNKTKLRAAVPFEDNINFHKVSINCSRSCHTWDKPFSMRFSSPSKCQQRIIRANGAIFGQTANKLSVLFKGMGRYHRNYNDGSNGYSLHACIATVQKEGSMAFGIHTTCLSLFIHSSLFMGSSSFFTHEWYNKTTWMYLAVRISIYAGERLIRAFTSSIKPVKILKVAVYPGNVLVLHMSKSQGFRYRSGQYIFVKCTAVSPFEWHPVSVTSAPRDDYLIVHFQTLGDWTRQLEVVYTVEPPPTGKNGLLRADFPEGENNPIFSTVLIDGPYSNPRLQGL